MATQDEVAVRLRLRDARKFQTDAKRSGKSIRGLGNDTRYADARARAATKTLDGYKSGLLTMGKYAAIGGATIVGLAGVVGGFAYSAFNESRKVVAQTGAVIKSTGGAANVTAKDVSSLATAISNKTGIDDEAIASGENLLLTFTNIRNEAGKGNDVFNQTTQAAVDMAAALGTDTKSAAMQLGKALNDPAKGLGKLKRSGVEFTDSQKAQVEALQKSGKTLEAQKIIIGEVMREFGGSAAAQATPWDKLRVTLGNLQESIGKLLAPTIDRAAKFLNRFIKGIISGKGQGGAFVQTLKKIANGFNKYVVKPATVAVKGIIDLYNGFKDGKGWAVALIATLAGFATFVGIIKAVSMVTKAWAAAQLLLNAAMAINPFVLIAAAIVGVGVALVIAYKKSKTFRDVVNAVFNGVKKAVLKVIDFILGGVSSFLTALADVMDAASKLPIVGKKFKGIGASIRGAADDVDALRDKIKGIPKNININTKVHAPNGNVVSGSTADLAFNKWATRRASGGFIPGMGRGDRTPLLAEPGEFVVRRAVSEKLGPRFLNSLNAGRVPALAAGAAGGEIVIHNVTNLDGRVIAESTAKHVANKQARR